MAYPILFDLDGTLVDPLLGVRNCLMKLCAAFDLEVPEEKVIRQWIGFGMHDSLATLRGLENPDRLEKAVDFFWDTYRQDGLFEHELYPGVHQFLHRLKRQGHRIYIVSAKPGIFARRIAYQFDLNLIFDQIYGSEIRGKWQGKAAVLKQLALSGAIKGQGVLVGDRGDDMTAAKQFGLRAVGVGYGYGSHEELTQGGAEVIIQSVTELDQWFKNEFPSEEKFDPFSRSE